MSKHHLPCKWCSSSDAMSEYVDGFKCYSCGKYVSKGKAYNTVDTRMPTDVKLPERSDDIPDAVRYFYSKYGLSWDTLAKYDIYYNKVWDRIIIPGHFENGWQARAYKPGQYPKYIQAEGAKPVIYYLPSERPTYCIVVEDAISAIKIREAIPQYNVVALLGTDLDRRGKKLGALIECGRKFIIWLDGDKPGRIAAHKLIKKLELVREVVGNIETVLDPKCYSATEIKDKLKVEDYAW